jgi:hypothetical protein
MARNDFFVTTAEVYNFLSGLNAPECEMYVHMHRTFGGIAKREGKKNAFAAHIAAFRSAFKNVVGVERERAMWATLLDQTGHELCGRCGGAGGAAQWPGYTCFDCGGRGYMPKRELQDA